MARSLNTTGYRSLDISLVRLTAEWRTARCRAGCQVAGRCRGRRMKISKLSARFRVDKPGRFRLGDFDPAETVGFSKTDAKKIVADHNERLADLQERLYAEDSWA